MQEGDVMPGGRRGGGGGPHANNNSCSSTRLATAHQRRLDAALFALQSAARKASTARSHLQQINASYGALARTQWSFDSLARPTGGLTRPGVLMHFPMRV